MPASKADIAISIRRWTSCRRLGVRIPPHGSLTEAKNAEVSARAAAIFQSSRHPRWPTHSRPQAHPAAAGLTHNPHSRFYSADLKHHASPERTATFLYDRARNGVVIPSRMFRPDRRSFESAQATNGSSGWLQKMSQLVREHDVFCRPP